MIGILWVILWVLPAYAHGPEQWIADNHLRDPKSKAFCCGPSDCHELGDGAVQEAPGGWIVKEENEITSENIPYERGLPVSPDGRFHRCGTTLNAVDALHFYFQTRCFIVPPSTM